MKTIYSKFKTLPIITAGVLAVTACTDSDYDFNEIDSTIGIGSDGDLSIPGGSTDIIKLDDVLELEGTECVKINDNGDYVFTQEGDDVAAVHPMIDKITISQKNSTGIDVPFSLAAGAKSHGTRAAVTGNSVTADGIIRMFEYSGDKPDGVKTINQATADAAFELDITFSSSLSQLVGTLNGLTVKFPAYMTLSNLNTSSSYTMNGAELKFANVPTNKKLVIKGNISKLDFDNPDKTLGKFEINGNTISMNGNIEVSASFNLSAIGSIAGIDMSKLYISSNMTLDKFIVTGATGQFSPEIALQNLGTVEVGDIPDFLTDGNVVIDLYNPQIILSIYNDMEVSGLVSGTMTAVKDGRETANITIPWIEIKPFKETQDGYTKICICRRAAGIAQGVYDEVVEISNISDLIRTIPDNISFSAKAKADDSKKSSMVFGRQYTVKPQYSIEAPLTFDKDARIVYTDSIDGWNEDIEEFELAEGARITLTGTIENRVPAYLTLKAKAIDVNDKEISADKINITVSETVAASTDGVTPATTDISVVLEQKQKGAMKQLDGLVLTFEGAATDGADSVTGITLNANNHSIIARDIKIKLTGKIIGDFN